MKVVHFHSELCFKRDAASRGGDPDDVTVVRLIIEHFAGHKGVSRYSEICSSVAHGVCVSAAEVGFDPERSHECPKGFVFLHASVIQSDRESRLKGTDIATRTLRA